MPLFLVCLLLILFLFFCLLFLDGYFEFVPFTGGHRRETLNLPEIQDMFKNEPALLNTWKFSFVSESIWDDPDHLLILRAFSVFDNYSNSAECHVNTCDTECMITIWNLMDENKVRYANWKENIKGAIDHLSVDMVSVSFLIFVTKVFVVG